MTFMRKFLDMLTIGKQETKREMENDSENILEEDEGESLADSKEPEENQDNNLQKQQDNFSIEQEHVCQMEQEKVLTEQRERKEKENSLNQVEVANQRAIRQKELNCKESAIRAKAAAEERAREETAQKVAEVLRLAELEKEEEVRRAEEERAISYKSNRMMIQGLHLYFIDIAREIVQSNKINTIPLMREYHLSESELNKIIGQIQDAKILDSNKNVLMGTEELERFLDIYEPRIFECENSVFDKEIFMVMGEIIYDNGIEDTYNTLTADEVVDYLNIMENLKIISYDNRKNQYDILVSKKEFYEICECIPNSFANTNYVDSEINYYKSDYDTMSGVEFEKYCAHILYLNGFSQIKITPASGDHGIDILAEKDGITYAIQCKCYSDNIGNAAVQQAHTGKSLYHKDIAVVLTNRYFTQQAKEEAQALGVKLWDRDKLEEMINNQ